MFRSNPKIDYFDSDSLRADLKAKTVRGGVAVGVAQGASIAITTLGVAILSRLLEPADFGLMTMATVFTGFAALFVDAGMSMATIQREHISRQQVSNLFWTSTAVGALMAVVTIASSPIIAWFYERWELIPVLAVLSINFLLSGLTIQHQALLTRAMQYGQLRFIAIVSTFVGQVVGIVWAWYFYHTPWAFWALPLMLIVTSSVRLAGAWGVTGWIPNRPSRAEGTREMVGFGASLTAGQLFNYFGAYFDQLLVGKVLGETALGLYERPGKIVLQPLQQISLPIRTVIVPSLSRLVGNAAGYVKAYQKAMLASSLLWMPVAAICIIDADHVVLTMLGDEFRESIPLLQRLSFAILVLPICNSTGWLFSSQGRGREQMIFQLFDAATRIALVLAALPWGLLGIATVYSLRMWLCVPPLFWYVGSSGPVRMGHLYRLLGTMLLLAAANAIPLYLLRLRGVTYAAWVELLLALLCCGVVTLLACWGMRDTRNLVGDLLSVIRPKHAK